MGAGVRTRVASTPLSPSRGGEGGGRCPETNPSACAENPKTYPTQGDCRGVLARQGQHVSSVREQRPFACPPFREGGRRARRERKGAGRRGGVFSSPAPRAPSSVATEQHYPNSVLGGLPPYEGLP